jgi:hypothetical protein
MKHMKEKNFSTKNDNNESEGAIDTMFTFSAPMFEILLVNKHLDRCATG